METKQALAALGALAQETRLEIFRTLVRAGPEGTPSGAVARRLSIPANTLSGHLAILERAGLAASRREGRLVYYAASVDSVGELIGFLLNDCCAGNPDMCEAVAKLSTQARCGGGGA